MRPISKLSIIAAVACVTGLAFAGPALAEEPVATLRATGSWKSEIFTHVTSSRCRDHANSIYVETGKDGAYSDQPFFLQVP
uniref:hypothetical protein n=1 Tax=Herbidospora sakaeratensis TaxID=564415 RepID=UPI000AC233D1|nr:hypothetical protein [Herbidospora sakaeratensis]